MYVCMYVCMLCINVKIIGCVPVVRSITLESAAALVARLGCECQYEVLEDDATSIAVEEDHSLESLRVGVCHPPAVEEKVILSYMYVCMYVCMYICTIKLL